MHHTRERSPTICVWKGPEKILKTVFKRYFTGRYQSPDSFPQCLKSIMTSYGQNVSYAGHLSFTEFQSPVLPRIWAEKKNFCMLIYLQTIQDFGKKCYGKIPVFLYVAFCWYRKLKFRALCANTCLTTFVIQKATDFSQFWSVTETHLTPQLY